jgi:hypothetical protein
MPRYYFSCEGALHFVDEIGTELADDAAARTQAVQQAGELLKDHSDKVGNASFWRMTVTDGSPRPVFVLNLKLERR